MPTELFDVQVDKVGLVKRGANKRRYFLMKGDNMETQEQALDIIEELEQEPEPQPESWPKLLKSIKLFFTPPPAEELETVVAKGDGEPDYEARLEALEKAQQAEIQKMADKVAEYEAKLAKAEEANEAAGQRVTELEKAAGIAEQVELAKMSNGKLTAEDLYALSKSEPDHYEKVVEMMKAFSAQVEETGLWKEQGSSQGGPSDGRGKFNARVAAIMQDEGLSQADAIVKAAHEMPDAYAEISKNAVEGKA